MSVCKVLIIDLFIGLFLIVFASGVFICFYGIKYMDKYFSELPNYKQESLSPFDCFERMHKYSFKFVFSVTRPPVSKLMEVWLFATCLSLTFYWIVWFLGALDYYFDIFS